MYSKRISHRWKKEVLTNGNSKRYKYCEKNNKIYKLNRHSEDTKTQNLNPLNQRTYNFKA